MLPTFCRVTGNSRNMPKPNYFPLLPPISPVEARRICRLMGRAVQPEDHLYVPVIEYARPSKQSNCHITGLAPPGQHHYQPNLQSSSPQSLQCRITSKHQINDDYKYVYPIVKEPPKPLKKVLERMSSRSELGPDQRFVYRLDENSTGLVVSAEMEAAIRRGEIESLSVSTDASSLLIRLKDGPSLTLGLQNGIDEAVKASTMEALFEGAGQDEDTLNKQVQIKQYKKRKISGHLSPNPSRPVSPMFEPDVPVNANWDERINYLTSANRSAANLLVVGSNWREILYPNPEAWDWETLKSIDADLPPQLKKYEITPLDVAAIRMAPGFIQSNQVPVINEEATGFDAVPLYSEKLPPLTHDHLQKLPIDYVKAVNGIQTPDTPPDFKNITQLKEIFNDVDSLLYLPFVHEVAALMPGIPNIELGYLTKTELDGVSFVRDLNDTPKDALVINGGLVQFNDDKRFVVGRMTSAGFVPGKMVAGRFEPGFVVQNAEGASFLPGCAINNHFTAGQLIREEASKFVTGQVVQTLLGPKFVPGRTILTDQGYKFVAGQTDTKTGQFHSGQIMQTEKGPTFIPGVTYDTPQGARFIAGQVDSSGTFVPGQTVQTEDGAHFVPGETLETADGLFFLPGQSYVNSHGKVKFCPGRAVDGAFVPGETMLPSSGGEQQFVAGVLVEEKFVPCKVVDGSVVAAESEEQVFTKTGVWSDGLPIDGSTFTALPRKKPDMGYMVQHEERIKFLPTEQSQDELLSGVDSGANIKIVPGQLLELGDTPKFVPGKKIESAVGSIFIPGQAVRTGPNKVEQFVPGQVIDGGKGPGAEEKGPTFCPGQMVNCETGKKFVPGQVFSGKNGPRFIPGKILMSPSGISTFIPGQVVYSCDRGSIFVPGNVVDTSKGPYFVPGRVVEQPNGSIKFVAGEIIETETGPHYVTPHETDIDLLDEEAKEIVVQGFPVSPEELRLITAYPFAALHYPTREGERPVINSRMLRQMAAAGIAVSRLTNTNLATDPNLASTLNDVIINAPRELDNDAILGADVNRQSEPVSIKPKKEKVKKVESPPPPPPPPVIEPPNPPLDDSAKGDEPIKPDEIEEPAPPARVADDSTDLVENANGTEPADGADAKDSLDAGRVEQANNEIPKDTNSSVNNDDASSKMPAEVKPIEKPAEPKPVVVEVKEEPKPKPQIVIEKPEPVEPKPIAEPAPEPRVIEQAKPVEIKVVEPPKEPPKVPDVVKTVEAPAPEPVQQDATDDSNETNSKTDGNESKMPVAESTGTKQEPVQKPAPPQPPPITPQQDAKNAQGQGSDQSNQLIKQEKDSLLDSAVAFVSVAPSPVRENTEPEPAPAAAAAAQVETSNDDDQTGAYAICSYCGIGSLIIQSEDGKLATTGMAICRSPSGVQQHHHPSPADASVSNKADNNTPGSADSLAKDHANNAGNANNEIGNGAKRLDGRLAPDGQESEALQKNLLESQQGGDSASLASTAGESNQIESSTIEPQKSASADSSNSLKKKRSKDSSKDSNELTLKTDMKIDESSEKTDQSSSDVAAKLERPSEMKGLVAGQSSPPLTNGKASPLSPAVDSSKLIDGWRYLHRATNGPQDADASPTSPTPIEVLDQAPPPKPRKFSRRVTSRSNSMRLQMSLDLNLSEEDSLELEDDSKTSQTEVPPVITSAKDISREVIDTLRYSRDEKKKAYYTQKILEAVGLSSSPPSNSGSGDRSRKTSTNTSACIILKDFLQTIIPAEAAHGVLIGGIDYMVIDDEGVRYFESASGFASRRNSRYDIRQAARSRSSSQDPMDEASGPWPWADVGPRQQSRRMSIDEFRRKLHESDSSATLLPPLSRSASSADMPFKSSNLALNANSKAQQHGRHSVASLPVSRRTSGYTTPVIEPRRRSSLVDDANCFPSPSNFSLPPTGQRRRKVGLAGEPHNKRTLFSRSSFDLDY